MSAYKSKSLNLVEDMSSGINGKFQLPDEHIISLVASAGIVKSNMHH